MESLIFFIVILIGFILVYLTESSADDDDWLVTTPKQIAKHSELKVLTILEEFKNNSKENSFEISYGDLFTKETSKYPSSSSDHLLLIRLKTGAFESKMIIDFEELTHLNLDESVKSVLGQVNFLINLHTDTVEAAHT